MTTMTEKDHAGAVMALVEWFGSQGIDVDDGADMLTTLIATLVCSSSHTWPDLLDGISCAQNDVLQKSMNKFLRMQLGKSKP